jgi:hypothetical protein
MLTGFTLKKKVNPTLRQQQSTQELQKIQNDLLSK